MLWNMDSALDRDGNKLQPIFREPRAIIHSVYVFMHLYFHLINIPE